MSSSSSSSSAPLQHSSAAAGSRTAREFDLIVYGASGFTGAFVAKYIHNLIVTSKCSRKWAIAGRSEAKLSSVMTELSAISGSFLPTLLIADAAKHEDLVAVCRQGKLLLNCTGPYRFLGESIVKACLDAQTDYMDICGEPQFMEKMFLDYHSVAEERGTVIISSCAFDSVPADLGCLFTQRQFSPNCCASIESFLQLNCGPEGLAGHYTTFECAVHGISDAETLKAIRRDINAKYNPPAIESPPGPKLNRISSYFWSEKRNSYAIPFMGADASVVKSTSRSISIKDKKDCETSKKQFPQYAAYVCVNGWINLSLMAVAGITISTLASWSWGRNLLLSYPYVSTLGVFSHEGPTTKQLETTSFEMHFYAKGYTDSSICGSSNGNSSSETPTPDKNVHVCISGPEPGYVATPMIFVTLALLLLDERPKLPKGGVLTPGAAFYDCHSAVDRLREAGIKFEVL